MFDFYAIGRNEDRGIKMHLWAFLISPLGYIQMTI